MVHNSAGALRVGIVGASGYGGAELVRLLEAHPTFDVATVAAAGSAGQRLDAVAPHLRGVAPAAATLVPSEPAALADCDVVFCATPHATSLTLAPDLVDAGKVVIDLSGAFRLDAATFTAAYGLAHPHPEATPAAYGLPELFRDELVGARLIAGPGCYPTASLLALAPLAGLVDPDGVVVVGMSGTSGAGKSLRADLHASHAFGNLVPYGAPSHRHTPEIALHWLRTAGSGRGDAAAAGSRPRLSFIPHLVPTARGMLCTVSAPLTHPLDGDALHARYVAAYADEPFVHVEEAGSWPSVAQVVGGNAAHLGAVVDEAAGRVLVACAIDNLVKGAAGQAVQAANVALGIDEGAGLTSAGMYP